MLALLPPLSPQLYRSIAENTSRSALLATASFFHWGTCARVLIRHGNRHHRISRSPPYTDPKFPRGGGMVSLQATRGGRGHELPFIVFTPTVLLAEPRRHLEQAASQPPPSSRGSAAGHGALDSSAPSTGRPSTCARRRPPPRLRRPPRRSRGVPSSSPPPLARRPHRDARDELPTPPLVVRLAAPAPMPSISISHRPDSPSPAVLSFTPHSVSAHMWPATFSSGHLRTRDLRRAPPARLWCHRPPPPRSVERTEEKGEK